MAFDKEFIFRSKYLPGLSYQFFKDMREERKFCDIIVRIGNVDVPANSIIIAAAIPYVKKEVLKNEGCEIIIPVPEDVSPGAVELLIDFAYSCQVQINTENVTCLLSAACLLEMDEVRTACCSFLMDNLSPENVMTVMNFKHLPEELLNDVDCYVRENFDVISQTEEFLCCSVSYLKELIQSDDLQVESEEEVYEAVMRWIKHSPAERELHLPEILRHVRLPLLGLQYLRQKVAKDELIHSSDACRDMLDEATDYHVVPGKLSATTFCVQQRCVGKKPDAVVEAGELDRLYAFCAKLTCTILQFDEDSKKWNSAKEDSFHINTAIVSQLSNKVCLMDCENMCFYTPGDNELNFTERYVQGRAFASIGNQLYVFGGSDGQTVFDTAECFDSEVEEWLKLSCMKESREYASCVALGTHLYVLGGNNPDCVHNSVERYDTVTDEWTFVAPMLTGRSRLGAAALNGKIYVCGGVTSLEELKCVCTAEVYDPGKNEWLFIAPMITARRSFSFLVYAGKLHALGGHDDGDGYVDAVEIYDTVTAAWEPGYPLEPEFQISGFAVI